MPVRRMAGTKLRDGNSTISHYKLSFGALAAAVWARPPVGRARPSPLHIMKALASKWYKSWAGASRSVQAIGGKEAGFSFWYRLGEGEA